MMIGVLTIATVLAATPASSAPASPPPPVVTTAPPAAQRVALLERVWGTINQAFFDPAFNGADWQGARQRYRAEVASAPNDEAAAAAIRRMLGELRTSHVDFTCVAPPPPPALASAAPAVGWQQLRPGLGMIRISRFAGGQAERDRLDKAFAALDLSRGLILDLRGNSGGDLSLGMRLADHLYASPQPIGLFATRAGLLRASVPSIDRLDRSAATTFTGYDIDEFQAALRRHGAVMLVSGGRAPGARSRRLAVLIDGRSASAAEGVAGSLKDAGALVVGETSAGAMLSSANFPVGGCWVLRLPVADHVTPKGKRLEGVGVQPDLRVAPDKAVSAATAALLRGRGGALSR